MSKQLDDIQLFSQIPHFRFLSIYEICNDKHPISLANWKQRFIKLYKTFIQNVYFICKLSKLFVNKIT